MIIRLSYKERKLFELQSIEQDGLQSLLLVESTDWAQYKITPWFFLVMDEVTKSFPDHKGRPGKVGGSLPRYADAAWIREHVQFDMIPDGANRIIEHLSNMYVRPQLMNYLKTVTNEMPIRDYTLVDGKWLFKRSGTLGYKKDLYAAAAADSDIGTIYINPNVMLYENLRHIVQHEFGHLVENHAEELVGNTIFRNYMNSVMTNLVHEMHDKGKDNVYKKYGLRDYSFSNTTELFADLFASFVNTASKSQMSAIRKLFINKYNKIIGRKIRDLVFEYPDSYKRSTS